MSTTAPAPPGTPGGNAPRRGQPWRFSRQPRQPQQANKKFSGQQQGEKVVFIKHRHWWFLLKPGWPAIILFLLLLGAITLRFITPSTFSPFWVVIEVLLGIPFLIFLIRWAYTDVANWWFRVFILTDKRIIIAHGLLEPNRKEAPLDKIQQVYQEARNLWEYLLNYGDVTILTAAGSIKFEGIAAPRLIVDKLLEAQREYGASRKAPEDTAIKDETMKRVIENLAKPTVIPQPPSPDPPPKPGTLHGPTRTFGGPLRLKCKIRYFPDERTIQYVQRHPYILFRNAFPGGGLIVIMLVLALVFHLFYWPVFIGGMVLGLGWIGYTYVDYADDVFILTTHRVIDIDRAAFIFYEGRAIVEYSKVQDVIVEVPSLIARTFDFGLIRVETAGAQQKVRMNDVPNPFAVQDAIFQRINAGKEREGVNAANKQKAEFKKWFAELANAMHDFRTPDLIGKPFEEAADLLSQHNLVLRVMGEQRTQGAPPGQVVQQAPPPGAMLSDQGQVYVILSKL